MIYHCTCNTLHSFYSLSHILVLLLRAGEASRHYSSRSSEVAKRYCLGCHRHPSSNCIYSLPNRGDSTCNTIQTCKKHLKGCGECIDLCLKCIKSCSSILAHMHISQPHRLTFSSAYLRLSLALDCNSCVGLHSISIQHPTLANTCTSDMGPLWFSWA